MRETSEQKPVSNPGGRVIKPFVPPSVTAPTVSEDPKLEKLKAAPAEVVAKAIHDMLLKEAMKGET